MATVKAGRARQAGMTSAGVGNVNPSTTSDVLRTSDVSIDTRYDEISNIAKLVNCHDFLSLNFVLSKYCWYTETTNNSFITPKVMINNSEELIKKRIFRRLRMRVQRYTGK